MVPPSCCHVSSSCPSSVNQIEKAEAGLFERIAQSVPNLLLKLCAFRGAGPGQVRHARIGGQVLGIYQMPLRMHYGKQSLFCSLCLLVRRMLLGVVDSLEVEDASPPLRRYQPCTTG
ncbi:MAG: hypothetical protein ACLQUY_20365 [Ktedonobacterales bacterium]